MNKRIVHTTAKDFFINLGMVGLLYFLVVNVLVLLFRTIDKVFSSGQFSYYNPDISFPLAALIVGFPLLLITGYILHAGDAHHPGKKDLPVRKWLSYTTLFIAGAVLVIDLVILLSKFLRGDDLTTAFLLKVLAVFAVALLVFSYYIIDLRYKGKLPLRAGAAFDATLFVVFAIGFGFWGFGSPATQRAERFDTVRINDMQNIQSHLLSYWQAKETLPETLEEASDALRGISIPKDPRTGVAYGYEKRGNTEFTLCADFERATRSSSQQTRLGIYNSGLEFWDHEAGETCFDRSIDPDRYPPYPKGLIQ